MISTRVWQPEKAGNIDTRLATRKPEKMGNINTLLPKLRRHEISTRLRQPKKAGNERNIDKCLSTRKGGKFGYASNSQKKGGKYRDVSANQKRREKSRRVCQPEKPGNIETRLPTRKGRKLISTRVFQQEKAGNMDTRLTAKKGGKYRHASANQKGQEISTQPKRWKIYKISGANLNGLQMLPRPQSRKHGETSRSSLSKMTYYCKMLL